MTRILRVVVGLSLAGVVAGCSAAPTEGVASPKPTAPSGATSTQASGLPHSGAPAVSNPLPQSVLPQDPCQAFTRQQIVEALGGDAPEGERDDIATGPWCSWQDPDTGAGVFVNFVTATHEGLSNLYRNTKPAVKVWREIPSIGGFPAVAFQTDAGETTCSVNVGLSDEYAVGVAVAPSRAKKGQVDACELSERLAETLVDNLREGAGR
ncbi:DUF3558 domain-containing protein [Saccharomonospora cyanea]|uniref:DUF3558 domain-containing protein n=1 Tax=Saccharomonospora cyanea NA-134 TaxID=882082 RepID=H5XD56_9PSEU|nr:DUF3558 domain-containing protein [Saccharomonospora cyanea]EHR63487.1 Protein of unknown function (DUF3558) [Saccharomonospora cyanea NA-134]